MKIPVAMAFLTWSSWFTWLLVAVIAAVTFLYWHMTKNYGYWESRGFKEVRPRHILEPFIAVSKRPLNNLEMEAYRACGRLYGSFEVNKPILNIADPDLLKRICVKDFHSFTNRRDFPIDDPAVGNMVTMLRDEQWKRVRTIITPTFTSGKMRKMAHLVSHCAEVLRDNFLKAASKGAPIDVNSYFGDFTMDTIVSCAFGTQLKMQENDNNPFMMHAKKLSMSFNVVTMFIFGVFPKLANILIVGKSLFPWESVNFFATLTKHIIQKRKDTGERGQDFLQLVMDASQGIDEEDPQENDQDPTQDQYIDGDKMAQLPKKIYKTLSEDEAMAQCFLFFSGYEATSAALAFAAYALALNPVCQDRLIKEVDEAWERNEGKMDYDVVFNMPYLEAVVSETLRMYTIATRVERVASEDYELGDTGVVIPKGTVVGIPIYYMHHDPEWYPDPETFDPERFSPENKASRNPYTYLPFGAGPRHCLATRFVLMEVKLCLVTVLRYVRFARSPETKVPPECKLSPALMLPKPIMLNIEKRKTT